MVADLRPWLGAAAVLARLAAGTALAQERASVFDDTQRKAIEGIVADYILDNPEIVDRAL